MKAFPIVALALSALGVSAAEPYIDGEVIFDKPAGSSWATITYTLKGAPAIVTFDIETNTLDNAADTALTTMSDRRTRARRAKWNWVIPARGSVCPRDSSRKGKPEI